MKISNKKAAELYTTISKTIMDLRAELYGNKDIKIQDIDEKLFHLEVQLWDRVAKVLNIDDVI